ncbi:hypothetical protein GCM10027035_48400 [Emticicia sediminis]
MKTDKFDEEFRRKVENFHPPFNDKEIDRIQSYVGQHIPLSFWQRFGHVFTYSVGTLIIVTLLTTTVYKTYENKSLLKQISVLNNQLEQEKADSIVTTIVPKEIVVKKTDTVFVTKYIPIPANNESESLADKITKTTELNTSSKFVQESIKDAKNNIESIDRELIKANSSENNLDKNVSKVRKTDASIKKFSKQNEPPRYNNESVNESSVSLKSTNTEKRDFLLTEQISANSIDASLPISKPNSVAKAPESFKFNDAHLSHRSYSFGENKAVFDLSSRNFILPKLSVKISNKKSFNLPTITLPNLKYRVGFGVEMADEYGGFNILTDILVSKRWSITTGIGFATFFDEEDFDDEDEFKRDTKKDFRKEYESRINDNSQINDIHINQALFKVPVYINYRLPLPKNFTVLLTAGSNLDVYSRQFVSYSDQNSFRDKDHHRFSISGKTQLFNNLLFSTGIEKRWQKYSIQLSPYFITQIKPILYQEENWQIGIKLNGFYRLSR